MATSDIIGTPRPVTAGLGLWEEQPKARASDPATSHEAAESARLNVRTGSQRRKLLDAFKEAGDAGLTHEQAAMAAGISLASEYSTRCSELSNAKFLEATGEKRVGSRGLDRAVFRITDAGRKA
jgi:hypothetical protein